MMTIIFIIVAWRRQQLADGKNYVVLFDRWSVWKE